MVGPEILQGRYRLDERLAMGGMGTVYSATDERLGRKVAVKILKDEFSTDPRFVERFRREARAVATLSHPNIAAIFDYGQDERHFIVMELIEGRDLARVLREQGVLAPEHAANIAAQITTALAHAHAGGIIHRDIKPSNVIIDITDRVKVTDFGIARALGESTLTATGSVLGTAQYLSPEQADGAGAGPHSDIYSAGVVLFEMLTGTVPFTGESALAVVMRHVSDDVPSPSSVNPDVPAGLDAIVARATAKDPQDRFSTAQEMAEALTEFTAPTAPAPVGVAAGKTAVLEPMTDTKRQTGAPSGAGLPPGIGRVVAITLLGLAAAAVLLWLFIPSGENPSEVSQERQTPQEEETPQQAPASYTIEEDLIGMHKDATKEYLEGLGLGFKIEEDKVENDDFEKDLVVDISPGVGTVVEEGSTITLLVSEGPEDGDDDNGPPDTPPGQDKKDKDKEEGDD